MATDHDFRHGVVAGVKSSVSRSSLEMMQYAVFRAPVGILECVVESVAVAW